MSEATRYGYKRAAIIDMVELTAETRCRLEDRAIYLNEAENIETFAKGLGYMDYSGFLEHFADADCMCIPVFMTPTEWLDRHDEAWRCDFEEQGFTRSGLLDGVLFELHGAGADASLIVHGSKCLQLFKPCSPVFSGHRITPEARLYHESVADLSSSWFGYAVPYTWMEHPAKNDGAMWVPPMPHTMTPHEGAIQFFLTWFDGLEIDESIGDIEHAVAFASTLDDLKRLGHNYMPTFVIPDAATLNAVTDWCSAVADCIDDMLLPTV